MEAKTLIEAMAAIGFTEEDISTMHLTEAMKTFVDKVNALDDAGQTLPEYVIEVYNDVGPENPITDWPEPAPIKAPRVLPPQCLPRPKPEVVPEPEPEPEPEPPKRRGRPPGPMPLKAYEKNKTVVKKLRGMAVSYSRLTAILEAMRVGGTREEIIKRADRLYMQHGGGSNIRETMLSYIKAMRVLKVLKLVNIDVANIKLKKFFTADSHQYKEYRKLKGKAEA